MPLSPADLRAYLARDWGRLRDLKRAYWRARLDRGGLAEALRISELMRAPATDAAREEDLQTHQFVAEALAKTKPRARKGRGTRSAGARRLRRAR